MNHILMDIVFEFIMFLELTDDEDLDPDLAVQHLEQISYFLHMLTPAERQELVHHAEVCAAAERMRQTGGQERAEVLATFEQYTFLMNELED